MNVFFYLYGSEDSYLVRPSSWGRARWSWPSLSPFSSRRKPPLAPPLPPSCPSGRSPTQTAKSPCPRWLACTSTRLSRAARKKILPPQTMRTLSRFCRTVLSDAEVLCSMFYKTLEIQNQQHVFFAAQA